MEIPYIVTPRKDTGLFNSKIAIWLFLASEVMLFGGFFSAYVFLRLGADYPWPERTLPVLPGLINTFVLIGSSVTVVFAWASLKMRKWRHFQIYMGITITCALLFMVLKAVEYNVKFHHQAVRLTDYTVVEGHLGYEKENGEYVLDHHGRKIEENMIQIEASGLTFSTVRHHKPWVEELITQAEHRKSEIKLAADVKGRTEEGGRDDVVIAKAGEPLSLALLAKIREAHLDARAHNGALRTAGLRSEWKKAKTENPGKRGWELASAVNVDVKALDEAKKLLTEFSTVSFKVDPPARFDFKPRDVREGATQSRLRDDTVIDGKLLPSPMVFHYVDAIDFRHLAMKAVEKGQDPIDAVENSWLVQNHAFAREAWEWNKAQVAKLEAALLKDYGVDQETGKPKREPTAKERYRIDWKDFVAKSDGVDRGKGAIAVKEEFMGPDYKGREAKETFPEHFSLPREQVRFASKFTPAWNTYYAIYFAITGLHGLHVIGGALVLAYYLFFGRKMYDSNPEWLANRVEVGGLFWHFVDLVWIFVFPIFYLM
ncbi:MAG: cytochrome c oxidase subunit 3 [Akkermansiaceae bacterium]|jgi:heme/copper-type cytochrome/quinol oxidase subunit 3|nr:cytochrome c oxidase subunit 3 [Akkermansiaceae bacterium]